MKVRVFLLAILSAGILAGAAQNAWLQKADFPGDPRSACSAFSFSDYGLVGLGYDGLAFRRSFYIYDQELNIWTQVLSMGGETGEGLERNVASSFTIGNYGYVGTGQGGAYYLNDFWQYDPVLNGWTQKADFGGSARRSAVGFAANGYGFIALGQDVTGFKKDVWKYDPSANTWTAVSNFPGTGRRLAIAFVANDKAYVGTGDDGTFTNDFYEYDPGMDDWFARADFPGSPRYGATAFSLENIGYVLTGYDTTLENRDDFWKYDPGLDNWSEMPDPFPGGPRANAVSFTIGDTMAYVGMGYDTAFHNDIWLWGDTTYIQPVDTDTVDIVTVPLLNLSSSIWPNPVSLYATITIPMQQPVLPSDMDFRIYDMQATDVTSGIKILTAANDGNSAVISFQRKSLPQGMYCYIVHTGKYAAYGKFIVL